MRKVLYPLVCSLYTFTASVSAQEVEEEYFDDGYYNNGSHIFYCLPAGGSCEGRVLRAGRETIHVRFIEDCEVKQSFLGVFGTTYFGLSNISEGDEEWMSRRVTANSYRDCR